MKHHITSDLYLTSQQNSALTLRPHLRLDYIWDQGGHDGIALLRLQRNTSDLKSCQVCVRSETSQISKAAKLYCGICIMPRLRELTCNSLTRQRSRYILRLTVLQDPPNEKALIILNIFKY